MRLLLDECVNEQLRQHFPGHECLTARYAGFAGLENGELLEAAEAAKFDVVLTVFTRRLTKAAACIFGRPIIGLNYLAGAASKGRTSRSTFSAISSSATSRS
jgi:hypothetical protein